jgi:hypothetical protein
VRVAKEYTEKRVDKRIWVEPALLLSLLIQYSIIVALDTKGDLRTTERDRERPTASSNPRKLTQIAIEHYLPTFIAIYCNTPHASTIVVGTYGMYVCTV